jgi:hypothetical protein
VDAVRRGGHVPVVQQHPAALVARYPDVNLQRGIRMALVPKEPLLVKVTEFEQPSRVARWFVFKQKIQIWVNFGGP